MIGRCMKRSVVVVPASATVRDAARIVVEKRVGTLPVVDSEGVLVGIVRLEDLLGVFMPDFVDLMEDIDFVHDFGILETLQPAEIAEADRLTMRDLMGLPVAVEPDCGLLRALAVLVKHGMRDLVVVDGAGHPVGIASRVDIGTAFFATWTDTQATP